MRPRRQQLRGGITFHENEIESVSTDHDRVSLDDGTVLPYDVLVVASGVRLQPEETEGMTGPGWNERVFTFYDLPGATALQQVLRRFDGGRLVVNIADMPIKCPVAPIEFAFLADWYLRERGIRARSEIVLATPLDGCFTKPIASEHLTHLLGEKEIELVTEFSAGEIDGVGGKLVSYDGREVDFDLLVTVPLHGGAAYVERSPGLGDALGFVPTDPHTLQTKAKPNVFALGDATDVPTSKAGSVTHFEGELLDANIAHYFRGEELEASFDGHANCFIETGFHKALLIDFNYDTEPLPGPLPDRVRATAAAARVAAQPPRQADVPVGLLARAPARPRDPRPRPGDADRRQEAHPRPRLTKEGTKMTMTLIADAPVDVDAEGFLTKAEQWNEQIAQAIAADNGVPELTDRHWLVVRFMRERYLATGTAPSIRSLGKESGVPVKELYQLFPKGPAKLAAKIGGIPKPKGCI